jgi:hypothetical protein
VVVAARLFGREVQFVAILEHRSSVEHRMALRPDASPQIAPSISVIP